MSKYSKCMDIYEKNDEVVFWDLFFFLLIFNLLGCILRFWNIFKGGLFIVNRIWNERFEIKLIEEEKVFFEEKRKFVKCKNMSYFICKCVLEKEIY